MFTPPPPPPPLAKILVKILTRPACKNHANTLQESGMIFPEHNKILAKSCQVFKIEICDSHWEKGPLR